MFHLIEKGSYVDPFLWGKNTLGFQFAAWFYFLLPTELPLVVTQDVRASAFKI